MPFEFHPELPDVWYGVVFARLGANGKQYCIVQGLTPQEVVLFKKTHEAGFLRHGLTLGWGRGDF